MSYFKSTSSRRLILLTIVGLLVRFALFGVAVWEPVRFLTPDSPTYLNPANSLIEYGGFAVFRNGTLMPYFLRTPGYPGFLAFVKLVFRKNPVIPSIILQNLLGMLTVLATYKTTELIGNKTAAFFGGLFVALSPISVIYSNYLLSETIFTAVLIVGFYFFIKYLQRKRVLFLCLTSFLFAFSAYFRPISLYLFIPLSIGIGLIHHTDFRLSLKRSLLFLFMFLLVLSPWFIRNYNISNAITFSTIQSTNLLYYRAAGVKAELLGRDFQSEEVVNSLNNRVEKNFGPGMSKVEKSEVQSKEALKIILTHPLIYTKVAAKGAFRLLIGPGRSSLARLLGYGQIVDNHFQIENYNLTMKFIIVLEVLYLLVLYIFAGLGFLSLTIQNRWLTIFVFFLIIFYLIVISSGPESYSRFRTPIEPLFAILAGFGFSGYSSVLSQNLRRLFSIKE